MQHVAETPSTSCWRALLDEHRQIAQLAFALERDAERFVAGEQGLYERIIEDSGQLIEILASHFANEEQAGGLFEFLRASLPARAGEVEALEAEHRDFLGDVYELQHVLRGESDIDLDAFVSLVRGFLERLERHDRKEDGLFVEAVTGRPVEAG